MSLTPRSSNTVRSTSCVAISIASRESCRAGAAFARRILTEQAAQHRPIHLEGGCSGKLVDEAPPGWNVRCRNVLAQKRFERGFGRLLNAGLELDGGSGYLPQPPVRDADDRRRRDGW